LKYKRRTICHQAVALGGGLVIEGWPTEKIISYIKEILVAPHIVLKTIPIGIPTIIRSRNLCRIFTLKIV